MVEYLEVGMRLHAMYKDDGGLQEFGEALLRRSRVY